MSNVYKTIVRRTKYNKDSAVDARRCRGAKSPNSSLFHDCILPHVTSRSTWSNLVHCAATASRWHGGRIQYVRCRPENIVIHKLPWKCTKQARLTPRERFVWKRICEEQFVVWLLLIRASVTCNRMNNLYSLLRAMILHCVVKQIYWVDTNTQAVVGMWG